MSAAALPEGLELGAVRVDGRSVPVYRHGPDDGIPMLALHGGYTDPVQDWGMLVGRLDPRLSITLPLLRGHAGREIEPGQTIGPVAVAEDLTAMVAAAGWRRPVLAGFSLGARGAMLAVAGGLEVSALVLLGTRFVAFRAPEFADHERAALERWPAWQDPARAHVLRAMRAGIVAVDIDLEAWVEAIRDVPVLVLRGERDRVVPAAEMERLAELAPWVRMVTVAGRGHRLQDKAADEVAAHVNRFLAEVLSR